MATDRDQKHSFERFNHIIVVIGNKINCLCRQFDQSALNSCINPLIRVCTPVGLPSAARLGSKRGRFLPRELRFGTPIAISLLLEIEHRRIPAKEIFKIERAKLKLSLNKQQPETAARTPLEHSSICCCLCRPIREQCRLSYRSVGGTLLQADQGTQAATILTSTEFDAGRSRKAFISIAPSGVIMDDGRRPVGPFSANRKFVCVKWWENECPTSGARFWFGCLSFFFFHFGIWQSTIAHTHNSAARGLVHTSLRSLCDDTSNFFLCCSRLDLCFLHPRYRFSLIDCTSPAHLPTHTLHYSKQTWNPPHQVNHGPGSLEAVLVLAAGAAVVLVLALAAEAPVVLVLAPGVAGAAVVLCRLCRVSYNERV